MSWVLEHWEIVLAAVVAAATAITRITPSPKDDEVVGKVKSALSRLSLLHPLDSGKDWKMPGKTSPKARDLRDD